MSSAPTAVRSEAKVADDWTIMIFFAGDPHLSPSMTSQLKAIKDAGFQENTTVLVHYDPNERGVDTTTFNINIKQKEETRQNGEKGTRIGDGKDPFVRNLLEDNIPGVDRSATAVEALRMFLTNGVKNHAAKHYLVFCVGHGVIVGNDFFLPDNQPNSAISLQQLGEVFSDFKILAKAFKGGEVELIGLHSCSMSGIEVAYQLKGAAKYLMATEGVSFVSSWPYRQLLKKTLKTIDDAEEQGVAVNVDKLVNSIQRLSLHNSTDFMFSGLSADLCLSSLDPAKIDALTEPLQKLVQALKKGLKDKRGVELIKLAHLKAQSYWQETQTDLYDFCFCLEKECNESEVHDEMAAACKAMRKKLEESPDNAIIQSDFFGPLSQYSHGYSVFFPWARPVQDLSAAEDDDMLLRYKNYAFTTALKEDSWLSFLEAYFAKTQRDPREVEEKEMLEAAKGEKKTETKHAAAKPETGSNGRSSAAPINAAGAIDAYDALPLQPPDKGSPALEKGSPALTDAMRCTCSVKNYPMKFFRSPRALQDANLELPAEGAPVAKAPVRSHT